MPPKYIRDTSREQGSSTLPRIQSPALGEGLQLRAELPLAWPLTRPGRVRSVGLQAVRSP
jgi:hypothetical protein